MSLQTVSDPHPQKAAAPDRRSLIQKVIDWLHPGPDSPQELLRMLAQAQERQLISPDSRGMIEGVLRVADMTAGDVMIAAPRMDLIDIDADLDEILNQIIDIAHSRYPVFEGDRENIIGVLLAKDLLKLRRAPELNLRALLRPAIFVPESKRLTDLLRDFRKNRNHLAMVVDEFGRIAGLLTIEDVLEEIVGEIEDEFDTQIEAGDIVTRADRSHRVSGDASIERVNEFFGVSLHSPDDEFETIGGLIAHEIGHVPSRGERHEMAGLVFEVMLTRSGAVKWFKVRPKG
jgi:magnesium and cobalt transporter